MIGQPRTCHDGSGTAKYYRYCDAWLHGGIIAIPSLSLLELEHKGIEAPFQQTRIMALVRNQAFAMDG